MTSVIIDPNTGRSIRHGEEKRSNSATAAHIIAGSNSANRSHSESGGTLDMGEDNSQDNEVENSFVARQLARQESGLER